jgi:hypothetical protein
MAPPIHDTRSVWSRIQLMLAATAVITTTAAACSGSGASITHSSATTPVHATSAASPTAPPLSPADQARTQALAAYRSMWADMVAVSATGNYRDPRLARHASGQAYSLLYQGVFMLQENGLVTKGTPVLNPLVASLNSAIDPTAVTVQDCFDDTHWLNYRLNGELQDNTPGGHEKTEAIVVSEAGVWKVNRLAIQGSGTC